MLCEAWPLPSDSISSSGDLLLVLCIHTHISWLTETCTNPISTAESYLPLTFSPTTPLFCLTFSLLSGLGVLSAQDWSLYPCPGFHPPIPSPSCWMFPFSVGGGRHHCLSQRLPPAQSVPCYFLLASQSPSFIRGLPFAVLCSEKVLCSDL